MSLYNRQTLNKVKINNKIISTPFIDGREGRLLTFFSYEGGGGGGGLIRAGRLIDALR